MEKLSVVTSLWVTQSIAAACIGVANNYPLLLMLLLIPSALGGIAWITFQLFKNPANVLGKFSALLGWSGFLVACLSGGCSYFVNTPHPIQIASCGAFAWMIGAYVTLTWAKLWEPRQLRAAAVESLQANAYRSQPHSAEELFRRQLLAIERWIRVIEEFKQDSYASCARDSKNGQIGCSFGQEDKEEVYFTSSQRDSVLLMWGPPPDHRRMLPSSSPSRGRHRQDRYLHWRMRCTKSPP
jgi:hypothetical protein